MQVTVEPWHQRKALRCRQVQCMRQHNRHCVQEALLPESICKRYPQSSANAACGFVVLTGGRRYDWKQMARPHVR